MLTITVVILLMIPALACGGTAQLPDIDQVAGQAQEAATKAVSAAATAVVVAQQAADTAATLAASDQAQNLSATAVAVATSLANVELPDTSALKEKIASIEPDANGNISVIITQEELNQAIQIKQAAAAEAGEDTVVQGTAVSFTGGHILFTGNITNPVTAQLAIAFQPFVAGGILQFNVVNATIGTISVPGPILSIAESNLNNTLNDALSVLPTSFVLENVIMGEGTMTINGHQN
jgi:uncharacterized protein YpmS